MKILRRIILIIAIICFVSSASYLAYYFISGINAQNDIEKLIDMVTEDTPSQDNNGSQTQPQTEPDGTLTKYNRLHAMNPDLIGWISIPNTILNYPVMYNSEDPEYYLYRNFEKEDEKSGLPFLDERCDINLPSTNFIIYGHSMKNGTMFGSLLKYKNESYYKEHPIILFDTLYEQGRYEIVSVLVTRIYKEDEDAFKYYEFINADTKEEFDEFISEVKRLSEYDTGVTAEYGDQLITLSTCEYSNEEGRLAFIARKIDE